MLRGVAGANPGIDEQLRVVIHPQACGVVGLDAELVVARLLGDHTSAPLHRELFGPNRRIGASVAEMEGNLRIDPFENPLVTVEAAGAEVLSFEAALVGNRCLSAEACHQIHRGVEVLPHSEPDQLDPCRGHVGFLPASVERLVDEFGDATRVVAGTRLGIIGRHRVVDDLTQLAERVLTLKRSRVFIRHAFPVGAVAAGTLRSVDRFAAGRRIGDRRIGSNRRTQRGGHEPCCRQHEQWGSKRPEILTGHRGRLGGWWGGSCLGQALAGGCRNGQGTAVRFE